MTIEQRNLIISIVAVLIIGGGVYFYTKDKNDSGVPFGGGEVETPLIPSIFDDEEEASQPTTPATGGGQITNENPSAEAQTQLLAKFNLALSNAQKEAGKGNYALALKYYNEALTYKKADIVYSGMFNVYSAQMNWTKAEEVINKALDLNPRYTEYWKWKLTLLDEQTTTSFISLKQIYEIGLAKSDARTAINLVTHFAVMAEANGEKTEAIALWEYAKTLNSAKTTIYQAEIDRLSS